MDYKKAISDRFKTKSSSNSTTAIIIAAAGGVIAGALVSLLLAPKSGKETRGLIAHKTKDLADGMMHRFKSMKERRKNHTSAMADDMGNQYDSVRNGISGM